MRRSIASNFLSAFVILAACAASGCAPDDALGTVDPEALGLLGVDGKADGDPFAKLYGDRVRIAPAGVVTADFGTEYRDTLAWNLPDSGVDLIDAWIEGTENLGIPEGSFTELGVYRLHKPASLRGHIYIEGAGDLALQLIRKRVGGNASVSAYVDKRYPLDIGLPESEVDYVVIVGPSRAHARGEDALTFSKLRFSIK